MCCLASFKRKCIAWFEKSPINPFTLSVKDKDVQKNYDVWKRQIVYTVVKVLCMLSWPTLLIYLTWNYEHGFEYHARFYTQFGSLTVSLTIMLIAMRIRTVSADFVPIVIIGVRVAVTFLLFYFISAGTKGFELVDKK